MNTENLIVTFPSEELKTKAIIDTVLRAEGAPKRIIKYGVWANDFDDEGQLKEYHKEITVKASIMLFAEEITKGKNTLFHGEIEIDTDPAPLAYPIQDSDLVIHYVVNATWRTGIKRLGKYKFTVIINKERPNYLDLHITKGKETRVIGYDIMLVAKKAPVDNWVNIDKERAAKPFDVDAFNAESKVILASIK